MRARARSRWCAGTAMAHSPDDVHLAQATAFETPVLLRSQGWCGAALPLGSSLFMVRGREGVAVAHTCLLLLL